MFERVALSSVTYNLESLDIERIVVKRLAIGPLGRCLIDGDMANNIIYTLWFTHILDAENPKSILTLAWVRTLQHERVCACGGVVGTLRHGGAQRGKCLLEKKIIKNHHNA